MKKTALFSFGGVLLAMLLAACATTDYDVEKQKAISEDNRRLGEAYARQGDYTNALRYYLEAAKHYPDDPELQYSLGMAYQEKMNYSRSIDHFNRALTLKPDMTKAKISMGVSYIKAKEYDQAIIVLEKAIDNLEFEIYTKPQYPNYLLGWTYYLKKQYPESERYLQKALDYYAPGITKDPIYVQSLRSMGLVALAQSNPSKALSYLQKAIPFAPKWPELYLDIARASRLAGFKSQAREAYNRVIELAPATDIADTAAREAASL